MTQFTLRRAWAIAALFAAMTCSIGFTACSDDDSVNSTPTEPLVKDLVGTWFSSYGQTGSLTTAKGQTVQYIKGVQALTFNTDGTGTCYKFLCDITGQPVSLYGGEGDAVNGRFHYTVGKDSVITITRDGDGDTANPKTWTLSFGTNGLNGNDNGTPYQMQSADAEWQDYIAGLEESYRAGTNEDLSKDDFLTDWQNCKKVYLEGIAKMQYLPWAGTADSDIADEIRFDVQKEAGWEMAFCSLNDPNSANTRFFGLYNRFTGTLRVFNYVLNPGSQGYGKEMGYQFTADGSEYMPRYPLYNSMEYAIPVCHDYKDPNTFDRLAILTTNGSQYKPFETMLSAYTRNTTAIGVSAGWHCTDFDFSGYTEKGIHWTDNAAEEGTLLSIRTYSQNTSDVLLTGTIIGSLEGEFKDPQYKTQSTGNPTLSAISGVVSTLSSGFSGSFGSFNQAYSMLSNADKLRTGYNLILDYRSISGLFFGATGMNILACGLKIADQFAGGGKETKLVSPGTINMTLDAKVDLNGTIKTWNSVNDAGVRITPELLNISNASKDTIWMGAGCLGLAKDPLVCISQEDLLSVSSSISIKKEGNNYNAPSFPKDSVRLVSFVDPRSVELCLNTDAYHDIDSVYVVINYGINANRQVGNTDCYRQMLRLGQRPTFSIVPKSGSNKLTTATTPKLHVMKKATVIKNDLYANNQLDSVKLEYQNNSVLPLYGRFDSFLGKRFVMDPQVFVPFDPKSTTVYGVEVPDFVVTVMVAFKCRECPEGVVFSRLYIPEIKLINHKDLATYYNDLKAYSDKCIANKPVGTVHNASNIKVYNKCGDVMLAKTLDILNKCK